MIKRGSYLLLALLLTLLSSCGFHLRGSRPLPDTLQVVQIEAADPHGYLARQIVNRLHDSGSRVVDDGPVVINIGKEEITRRSLAYTAQARVAEFELIMDINYWADMKDPAIRIAQHKIRVSKSYSYDPTNPSGKSEEENLLRQEMRRDVLDQLMRELYLLPSKETIQNLVSTQRSSASKLEQIKQDLPVQSAPAP
ncbi:MAG TPA: LPS assembly lipoprotein LptE [Pseudomonadales bacterium]|nr:LPS assembly lipoprotein LptE [Pseudomonadales bacterium]